MVLCAMSLGCSMSTVSHNDATQIARRLLADQLTEMADHVRAGKAPLWAMRAIGASIAMCRHVIMGTRGRYTNVTELAPWARAHDGAENARHCLDIGALRRQP